MKKRAFTAIMTGLLSITLLAGCGETAGNSNSEQTTEESSADTTGEKETKEDTSENKTDNNSAEDQKDASETEAQETKEFSDEVPTLIIHRFNENEWGQGSIPAIKHSYSYVTLEKDQQDALSGLTDSLNNAMNELLNKQQKAFDDDKETLKENPEFTFDESWLTYVRRADSKYVCILSEYCTTGQFDDGFYNEYTAHTYSTGSGEEIKFSDVVADEDAFYDLMTEKVYEYEDYAQKNKYMNDVNLDKSVIKSDLKEYMQSGKLAWTLDYQGVSFYINSYVALPESFSETILFSEDTDKKIFAPEFLETVPDQWIMQIPQYAGSYIDLTGNGVPEYVRAYEETDMQEFEGSEEYFVSGLGIVCSGEFIDSEITMPGGTDYYNVFLIHIDDSTILLESHDEYDQSFLNTFKLGKQTAEAVDSRMACIEWPSQDNYDPAGDGFVPIIFPNDPSSIRVLTGDSEFYGDLEPDIMNIDKNGLMSFASGRTAEVVKNESSGEEGGEQVEITDDMQKKLNLFISNFAEQGMSFIDMSEPDPYKIGYFAYKWTYINKNADVKVEGSDYTISYDIIKQLADKYLDIDLKKEDLTPFESLGQYGDYFKDGNYYIPAADGETYTGLAIVTSAEDIGGDALRVEFVVYHYDLDAYWDNDEKIPSEIYTLTAREANETPLLEETDRGYAKVKKVGDSYRLQFYELYR